MPSATLEASLSANAAVRVNSRIYHDAIIVPDAEQFRSRFHIAFRIAHVRLVLGEVRHGFFRDLSHPSPDRGCPRMAAQQAHEGNGASPPPRLSSARTALRTMGISSRRVNPPAEARPSIPAAGSDAAMHAHVAGLRLEPALPARGVETSSTAKRALLCRPGARAFDPAATVPNRPRPMSDPAS